MNQDITIIDVRSEMEYMMGHAEGSINIPLDQIPEHIEEIKKMNNPVFCCMSGGRSGAAVDFLQRHGIDCENGGCWENYM